MYTIYNDGQLLFTTAGADDEHIVLSPSLSQDVEGAGSLSFTMQKGHAQYNALRKLKGIITVMQDGKTIFRGRVMDDERDFYNQKTVYCEGDLSFLLDSIYAPGTYTGKVIDLFRLLIEEHNKQVDAEKRFTVGIVDAVTAEAPYEGDERVETRVYWDTSAIIHNRLIGPYGGYLRTRTEDGVTYIDWLKNTGSVNNQVAQFAVNLLDLKEKVDASDVFTVLLPHGYAEMGSDGSYGDPVSIADVNGGMEYIQDDEAVAVYGRIWKEKSWDWIKDPAQLMAKAREHLKTGVALQTLTLKLIDMHFITGDADAIQVGQYVRILSNPHGIDITLPCAKIDIDLLNPENTTYTFGIKPQTLTENVVRTEDSVDDLTGGGGRGGGGGKGVKDELSDILRWAKVQVDEANANILLTTGEVNKLEGRMTTAEIELDGLNASIILKAEATIVDELGKRVSAAEIDIDGLNSTISLKADKIDLQGYVTMQDFEAGIADLSAAFSDSISTEYLVASTYAAFNCPISYQGDTVNKTSIKVITGISGGGVNSTDATLLTTDVGGAYTIEAGSADALSARYTQGAQYAGALYQPGTARTIKQQGNLFQGTLFYGGSGETIYKRGDAYGGATLYIQVATNVYQRYNGSTLYYSGGSEWVVRQGEEYTAPLYEPGKDVTVIQQGESVEDLGITLYRQGNYYPNGLYTNFEPATITLQDITALTA